MVEQREKWVPTIYSGSGFDYGEGSSSLNYTTMFRLTNH